MGRLTDIHLSLKSSLSDLTYHGLTIASNKPSNKDGKASGSGEPLDTSQT